MTTTFVTRHEGAVEWARKHGIEADERIEQFDTSTVAPGDTVIGTLPVNLAGEVCARGGRYIHLSLEVPKSERGKELSANDMERFGATLEAYEVRRVEK